MRSFIDVPPESHFSLQNLPYGVFRLKLGGEPCIGAAIGDMIVDLSVLEKKGFFKKAAAGGLNLFSRGSLNLFMSQGRDTWKKVRAVLQDLLRDDNPILRDDKALRQISLVPMSDAEMCLPAEIGDYTDFYSSKEHATNVGTMFRGKENALMPNWVHLPVAYHGRSSSIVVSGTDIIRPKGQNKRDDEAFPRFGPSDMLDFELETGFFIGPGNELGKPIAAGRASSHIFGMVLVNDWSARDIQKWEYQPLGPFLAKNFATSISPWVVTMESLEPFRVKPPEQEPGPLPYLKGSEELTYDIRLEVFLKTEKMPEPFGISVSNFKYLYWRMEQQLAHHTVNGCSLRTGDLLASGTISGPSKDSCGSMLELTWKGDNPVKLPSGEERKFLQDGDTVIIKGYCQGDGYRVGFGDVTGRVLPAL